MKSKQYSQLHAVILCREHLVPARDIAIEDLARRLRLPVIAFVKKRRAGIKRSNRSMKASHYDLSIRGKRVSVIASRIGPERAQEIFAAACARDRSIPEAARVADLISEQVTLKWNSLGLG
jgi:endonuclease V-like protein UPF0215 family